MEVKFLIWGERYPYQFLPIIHSLLYNGFLSLARMHSNEPLYRAVKKKISTDQGVFPI